MEGPEALDPLLLVFARGMAAGRPASPPEPKEAEVSEVWGVPTLPELREEVPAEDEPVETEVEEGNRTALGKKLSPAACGFGFGADEEVNTEESGTRGELDALPFMLMVGLRGGGA